MINFHVWTNVLFQKVPAKQLNFLYSLFTRFYRQRSYVMLLESVIPRILPTEKQIEEKAATKLAQVLTMIKLAFFRKDKGNADCPCGFLQSSAERQDYRKKLSFKILELLSQGKLERTGSSIFLQEKDIQILADLIEVEKEYFLQKAAYLKILRNVMDDPTKLSYLRNELIELEGEQYTLQYYRVITKDGMVNNLTMLIDDLQVVAGDKSPSIILVPGIACNKNAFNVNEKYSIARDLARRGYWVYLFEPRGMGGNKASFDIDCTLDTLIDFELPAVVDFVYKRSKGKPVILLGHSMGGVIAEFMLQLFSKQKDEEFLSKIKGLITLGLPRHFNKDCHLIFPFLLWLNYILPLFKVDRVPIDETLLPLTKIPLLKSLFGMVLDTDPAGMNFLIQPDNFSESNFLLKFIATAVETFPLGIGFQFQKAIYTGKGITRMDHRFATNDEKYNYTKNTDVFSPKIPVVHFLAENDPLAIPNLNDFSRYYAHSNKKTIFLGNDWDVNFPSEPSQVTYFIVPKTKHIDLLYGKTASRWTHPIIMKAIQTMWAI